MEPWSADDPWQERRDPSPGWDEWSQPAPSADDYAVEQAAPSVSDPWAESWADEVPGIPTSPPPELESDSQPAPDAGSEPSAAPSFESTDASPVTSFEPWYDEQRGVSASAEAEPGEAEPAEAEPQPYVEAEPATAPRIEPWSPDSDPWGAAWTAPPVVEAAPEGEPVADDEVAAEQDADEPVADEEVAAEQDADEPVADETEVHVDEPILAAAIVADDAQEQVAEEQVAEEQVAEEPVAEEAEVRVEEQVAEESGADGEGSIEEPELGAEIAIVAASSTDTWRAPEPDVEPEPVTESDSRDDEPAISDAAIAAMVAGAAVEGAIDEEPARGDSRDDGPSFADAAMAATAAALAGGATRQEPSSEAPPGGDEWEADAELAAAADLEPPVEPEPPVEAEPAFPPPVWAQEPGPAPEDAEPSDVAGESADAEPEPEPRTSWEADLWSEPGPEPESEPPPELAALVAAGQPPDADLDSDDDDRHVPEAAIAAAAIAASQPEIEARRPDVPWLDRPDQTEVYPTTWEPPAPPPPAGRVDSGSVEPRTGEIRTTLGQAEPDLDDELAEEPTTAEAAVPWLIGVILLLAGMVIVLLALIFAGDASLGGGADASPTPSAAAVGVGGAGASTAPSPTPRTSPSPTPDPSGSPDAVPQYGDLEILYQGRSAALAPIYLLRRDFSVEGEPEVMAQDPNLDVRRFAWSPDGTRGAFLYADLMVAIDPGVDVHQLGDGISAITFGNGAKTVYAVRVVADGGNDVASILAVDQATGEERELDRVSYARPAIEAEVALAEAQFSDDGGSVRLYWMHDDSLRLWILGGGTWTLDPAQGNASKLDEGAPPVLWAPEGERRIRLVVNGDKTRLNLVDRSGDRSATTTVTGRVSHLRWSPRGDQVVFTLGRPTAGGGVLQDLYLWNLGEGDNPTPMMITNTGAGFGAEWRGSQARWEED